MKFIKKLKLLLISCLIIISNILVVNAKEVSENSLDISKTFKNQIALVFTDNEYTVHNESNDITDKFIRENKISYDNNNYVDIWHYFVNNKLYILGPTMVEKEVPKTRAISTITHRVSKAVFTILVAPNGHPSVEFQAYVHCQAQYNDRTGRYISVTKPYFGQVVLAPDNAKITVDADSSTNGTYCNFNLKSFVVTGFSMSGMLGTFVTYNRVVCNVTGIF